MPGSIHPACEATQARYEALLLDRLGLGAPLEPVARYALAAGKRARPLFVHAIGRTLGLAPPVLDEIAVAIEYLHTAALLLDDLPCMDDSQQRRGRPAAHVRFSEQEAVLTAVALLSRAYEVLLAASVADPSARGALVRLACATVAGVMAGGQALELNGEGADSLAAIREIHDRKTGALFLLAARLVTACAGSPPVTAAAIDRFATLFGRAFQIVDDLEDQETEEDRANLSLLVGVDEARAEAVALLDEAIESVEAIDKGALRACVDDLKRHMDSALCVAA